MWGPMRSSSYSDVAIARSLSRNAVNEPVIVKMLKRLRTEGLSRHDATQAIGSPLAAQVYNVLKRKQPDAGKTPANMALEPSSLMMT